MAYSISSTKHGQCFPTKVISGVGGGHIFNIILSTAADNGNIIGRGAWSATNFDSYAEAAAPNTFAGLILEKAADGWGWYVEVTAETEALLVYNSPIVPFDTPADFADPANFYNASGDVVKAYSLKKGDIFEVSAECFTGTPVAGKAVTVASKKLVVAQS